MFKHLNRFRNVAAPLRQTRNFQLICAGSASVVVIPSARQFLRVWRSSRTNTKSVDANSDGRKRFTHPTPAPAIRPLAHCSRRREAITQRCQTIFAKEDGSLWISERVSGGVSESEMQERNLRKYIQSRARPLQLRCSCGEIMKKLMSGQD